MELGAALKILVTGGAGFIGSYFVKRQLDKNPLGISEIIVLDKLTYAGNMENFSKNERELFRFVEADICDANATDSIIKTADYVIDVGPEGGDKGGEIVVAGTPEEVAECERSHTGRFLKPHLEKMYKQMEKDDSDSENLDDINDL